MIIEQPAHRQYSAPATDAERRRLQVVIVSAGFGGLTAALTPKRATVDITLVDWRLLSSVIGVGIESEDMLVHEVLSRNLRDRKAVAAQQPRSRSCARLRDHPLLKPLRQSAILPEAEKARGQPDHPAPHPGSAASCEASLAPQRPLSSGDPVRSAQRAPPLLPSRQSIPWSPIGW
jgi:hypothetical protein